MAVAARSWADTAAAADIAERPLALSASTSQTIRSATKDYGRVISSATQ